MSRTDHIIVRLKSPRKSARGLTGDAKRKAQDADIVINCEGFVVKDRFGPGLGNRYRTDEEDTKAEEIG